MGIEGYGGGQGPRPDVLVVTTNDPPGHRVQEVLGEVSGLTVRSRHLGSQIGAGLKPVVGGERRGLTKTLVEPAARRWSGSSSRHARGANAVPASRFDVTEAADVGTEVCAYGTAVGVGRRGGQGGRKQRCFPPLILRSSSPGVPPRPTTTAQGVCRTALARIASRR
ncbi:YbjQ family protein [Streptomyces ziwulingensis]